MLYLFLHPTETASMIDSQHHYISCTNRKQIRHTTIHCNTWKKYQPTAQSDDSAHSSCYRTPAALGPSLPKQWPLWQGQRDHTALETIWYPADLWNEAEATELEPVLVGWQICRWAVGTFLQRETLIRNLCNAFFTCSQVLDPVGTHRWNRRMMTACWWVFPRAGYRT